MGEFRYNSSGKLEKSDLEKYNLHISVRDGKPYVVSSVGGEDYDLIAGSAPLTVDSNIKDGAVVR
jgi:hypothetical protein